MTFDKNEEYTLRTRRRFDDCSSSRLEGPRRSLNVRTGFETPKTIDTSEQYIQGR